MNSFNRSPSCVPVVAMLSLLLSRTLCQVVTEANLKPYTSFASFIRTFTTSGPTCGGVDDNDTLVVTHSQLVTMLANRSIQLFDVRNPDEYQDGNIPQAVNIPLGTLEESLKLSPEIFKQKFNVKSPEKDDDNIVFHCRSGKRSLAALDIAHRLGFSRARHYKGGYSEWIELAGK
ncbi:unnamed protein product [Menidia menidia]|uniref:(Atlantic silverside) hypothetical protein n=1 Tax=Menidia menidia TaxID=238744 RepID=A0A8S4APH4_9TELE|nr:unnamed protein product [Menidia menidia]